MPKRPKNRSGPTRLAEYMARAHKTGAALARDADTSRQQIDKLVQGKIRLSKEWAERLAPHLNTTVVALLGLSPEDGERAEQVHSRGLIQMGRRLHWARSYRGLSVDEAAKRAEMTPDRLRRIELGEAEMRGMEVARLANRLGVSADFLLMGRWDLLPYHLASDYQRDMGSMDDPEDCPPAPPRLLTTGAMGNSD